MFFFKYIFRSSFPSAVLRRLLQACLCWNTSPSLSWNQHGLGISATLALSWNSLPSPDQRDGPIQTPLKRRSLGKYNVLSSKSYLLLSSFFSQGPQRLRRKRPSTSQPLPTQVKGRWWWSKQMRRTSALRGRRRQRRWPRRTSELRRRRRRRWPRRPRPRRRPKSAPRPCRLDILWLWWIQFIFEHRTRGGKISSPKTGKRCHIAFSARRLGPSRFLHLLLHSGYELSPFCKVVVANFNVVFEMDKSFEW